MNKIALILTYWKWFSGEEVQERVKLVGFKQIPNHTTFIVQDETLGDLIEKLKSLGVEVTISDDH